MRRDELPGNRWMDKDNTLEGWLLRSADFIIYRTFKSKFVNDLLIKQKADKAHWRFFPGVKSKRVDIFFDVLAQLSEWKEQFRMFLQIMFQNCYNRFQAGSRLDNQI